MAGTIEPIGRKEFLPPAISNAGNVLRVRVGGGHEGEAPMSLGVAERFVCWFCPPTGKVGDMFCGTSTTGHAALIHGRQFTGCDLRQSQIDISRRRLASITPALQPCEEIE